MLSVIKFILNCVIAFARMLFTINIGNGLNLGLLMCVIFIFLPITLRVLNLIRQDAIEELDDRYDTSRPVETNSYSRHQSIRMSPTEVYNYSHSVTQRRRRR